MNRLRDELTHVVAQTEGNSAMGLTDHNKIAENLICGLMREILGFRGLRNLNATERANYPAIDLADFGTRVAVQVTATATLPKIKGTIGKFIKHGLRASFDRLVVYILARKQDSYSQAAIDRVARPRLTFDSREDILDFRDLLEKAVYLEPVRLAGALRVIEAYNRGVPAGLAQEDFDPPQDAPEAATLNLVQLFFPRALFIADVAPEFLKRLPGFGRKPDRDVLRHHGRQRRKILPSDFYVYSNQLLTFHDLNDDNNPFAWAVDAGTIVEIAPHEFYGADEAQERVFKALLRYTLQAKLYRERVQWRHEEKLFAFMPLHDDDLHREIPWQGQKLSERHVYERKLSKKDADKVFTQKHLAFAVDFYRLDKQWFVSLTPDWFFSYGPDFKSSRFASGSISWLKRQENNAIIETHFRFLVSWLRELDAEDMFSQARKRPSVSIGNPVLLAGFPALPDDEWLPVQVVELDSETGDLFADREGGA
jgi:SMEK domain